MLKILIIFGLLLIDFFLKRYATVYLNRPIDFKIFIIDLTTNTGFIFGSFENVTTFFRVIGLGTFYGLLLILFLLFHYFLKDCAYRTKLGASVFFAGISANTLDQILYQFVIDYINIVIGDNIISFNLADVVQWVGISILILGIFREKNEIWYKNNLRSTYLIYPKYQIYFSTKILIINSICFFTLWVFSYIYLNHLNINNENIKIFNLSYMGIFGTFAIIIFYFSIIISHRICGPIFSFSNYVKKFLREDEVDSSLKFRSNDYFKELINLASQIKKEFENLRE